jgi:hypothetical protein
MPHIEASVDQQLVDEMVANLQGAAAAANAPSTAALAGQQSDEARYQARLRNSERVFLERIQGTRPKPL